MDYLIYLLVLVATLIISIKSYSKIHSFEISPHNKTHLFKFFFPPSVKYPKATYIGFSLLLMVVFLVTKDITWYSISVYVILLIMQMIIAIDIHSHKLPNAYVLPLIAISLVIGSIENGFLVTIGGMVLVFVIFLVIGMLKLGSFGGGDLKFAVIIGGLISVGNTDILLLIISLMFVYAGLFLFFYLSNNFLTRKDFIPMGPFLYLGFITYWLIETVIA